MYPVRILSIDGSGIRGIIPLKILAYIEKQTLKPIYQLFNVIGGISTSGIIALGLNSFKPGTNNVYTAEELMEFYTKDAHEIFNSSGKWQPGLSLSKYSHEDIEKYLKKKFGETSLQELPTDCDVTVYSYDLIKNEPFYFNNRDRSVPCLVWQAARATSAAPNFFPALKFEDKFEYGKDGKSLLRLLTDGGVYINNPTLNLLIRARYLYPHYPTQNQLLVSVGTDQFSEPLTSLENATAIKGDLFHLNEAWAGAIFNVALTGTSAEASDRVAELLDRIIFEGEGYEPRYYRFQKKFDKDVPIDGIFPEQLKYLQQLGDEIVKERRSELDRLCTTLTQEIPQSELVEV